MDFKLTFSHRFSTPEFKVYYTDRKVSAYGSGSHDPKMNQTAQHTEAAWSFASRIPGAFTRPFFETRLVFVPRK